MASQIHLIRHAESVHNVSKDFSQLDPSLTQLGFQQAAQLVQTFPYSERVAVVLTSPLQRAIQTTLAAFPHVLDKCYFDPNSGYGIQNGAKLVIDPDLQERSALPCDTGSHRSTLEKAFPRLSFERLEENWQLKEGLYSADDEAVEERVRRVRRSLENLIGQLEDKEKKDVVVVTHGVFMKFVTGDLDIDLPKAGWKSYTLRKDDGNGFVLVPVEGTADRHL
ncbi:phosphoglycerate mutase-like protein [Zopfia rhizophila CBS 207.26]|uniref:Phosphoglycerate mutase-like protein n=1 Tax=Zopfia rhizophila CBS 207.26 TaxID=1314779 RepID=A0A6A6DAA1_9PEZI|nr:phosphoglycerate mutase-like protein [Zopfia rhizophila CBS 207.26]